LPQKKEWEMIVRIGNHARITAVLTVCFALNSQLATSPRPYQPLFGGWIVFSSSAVADELDLWSSQESAGAHKIMNRKSTPLRMRAFRVIDRQGGSYFKWIVLEDIERAQFRVANYVAFGGGPTKGMKARMDHNDAWNVLNSLRNATRFPENDRPTADSIDDAIAQAQTEWQELQNLKSRAMSSTSVPRGDEPTGKDEGAKPMIRVIRGPEPADEESHQLQQMIDEVWDFGTGMHLEWRAGRRTTAGHECEVLTFDGSETVLVYLTSVEIPSQSK
jgi:hypothetical protein